MNYSNWPAKSEKIGSLFLDPKNPRLPIKSTPYTQSEIIEELIKRDDVYDIARNIVEDGYSPLEAIIIFENKEDSKKYVLEGNRRLTACKVLHNPNLAPEKFFKKFNELSNKFEPSGLKTIWSVVAPNRESALKILVRKHTKSSVRDWEPIMKANFYAQRIAEGMTVEQAANILGVSQSDVRNAVSLLQIYDSATKLDLEPNIGDIVRDPYKFEISTFDRLISNPKTKEFLGIATDNKTGDVVLKIELSEYRKGLTTFVTDLANKKENSRSLNNSKDIEGYLTDRIPNPSKPNLNKKIDSVKLKDLTNGTVESTVESARQHKQKTSRKPLGLIPGKFPCNVPNQKILDIYTELRKLSPDKFSNSCAMSLRMFLELSTYEYLDREGELAKWKDELKQKGMPTAKLRDWVPELKPMLSRIIQKKMIDDAQLLRSLNQFINDKAGQSILASLNQLVHNSKWHPNEDRLRHLWKDLAPYLSAINK